MTTQQGLSPLGSGRDVDNVETERRPSAPSAGATVEDRYSFSPVVVGIDGSRPGIDAALWAVDEAVSRDIPLRLV